MQMFNRRDVDNFLAQLGQPPVAIQVARQRRARRGIGRINPANTTRFQTDFTDGWTDGWGNTQYAKGDGNSTTSVSKDAYGNDIVLNPQIILASGASVPQTTAANTTDQSSSTSSTSNVTNIQNPMPGSNPAQLNYLTANPLVFQGSFNIQENYRRGLLLIQNQSSTNNLWVGFGVAAAVNSGLLLTPGLGILLDVKVPTNQIYGLLSGGGIGFVLEGTNNATTPLG